MQQKMSEYLFSYGTLQNEKVQLQLFKRILHGTTDKLMGYKTSTIEIKDEISGQSENHLIANISGNKADNIKGTVLELTQEELSIADQYETKEYKRVKVTLESSRESWVYVSSDK